MSFSEETSLAPTTDESVFVNKSSNISPLLAAYMPLGSLCDLCRTIFAQRPPVHRKEYPSGSLNYTRTALRDAALKGCPICESVVRSTNFKNAQLPAENEITINVSVGQNFHNHVSIHFRDDSTSSTFSVSLRLLPYRGTRPPAKLPARFLEIDLEQAEPVKRVRLRTGIQVAKYVTLSYCWGGNASHVPHLRNENLNGYLQEIIVGDLPKTFRDAFECAYRLGVRYLWIDSLCIIQDSEDWLQQSALMADIYAGSFLNLTATVSRTSNGGLFRCGARSHLNPCFVDLRYNDSYGDLFHCVEPNAWETSVNCGILNTRAWVLQEILLAPRTLHFVSDQIFWRCKSLLALEIYPDGIFEDYPEYNRRFQLTTGPSVWGSHAWFDIVESYTSRLLTKESVDKIVALSGVARHVAMNDGLREHDYLAGLWKHTLPLALIWRSESGGRPLQNGAPSWAWTSISGKIEFPLSGFTVKNVDVVEAHAKPRADPYGQVVGGKLRLSASVVAGGLSNLEGRDKICEECDRDLQCQDWVCAEDRHASKENAREEHIWHFQCRPMPHNCVHHVEFDLDDLALRGSRRLNRVYLCLFHVDWYLLRYVNGLVLEMVSTGIFRRLGHFSGGPDGLCFLHCAKTQQLGPDEFENFDCVDRYTFSII